MGKPNVTVAVEPSDGPSVFYETCASKDTSGKKSGLICLLLSITNHEANSIHLNQVTLSFSGRPAVPTAIPVPSNWWPPDGSGINIAPGGEASWNFLREGGENDAVVLPIPAPASVTLSLFFDGFDAPWTVTLALKAHRNPVAGDAYLFPARVDDLKSGEFWYTSSNIHATGASGSQLFAYDMGVAAWDDKSKDPFNRIHLGKDGTENSHYRVFGKEIHAMADGVIAQAIGDCPDNPKPIGPKFNGNKAHDDQLWTDQKNNYWGPYEAAHGGFSAVHGGSGNHFYIRHGDEIVLYAHMQKGTLNPNLPPNATVHAGDFLGLAGNSGNGSEPHLHIHSVKGTVPETGPLRPLLFRDMFVVDAADLTLPDISGPWSRVDRQGPPLGPPPSYIWPLRRHPEWRGWEDLGGSLTSAPAVSSWASHRLDVFAAGSDGALSHKSWDGFAWNLWQKRGGVFKDAPAAVSWGQNRIDVFVRGMDDHLGHLWWNGSSWNGWEDLGGSLTSAPAVSSWAANRLDVFAAGSDGELRHKSWDGSTWSGWQKLGGAFKGAPAAVSWGQNRIDVFVRGMDDHLGHLWWNGSSWNGWEDLGGSLTSAPAVSSWAANRLDVFAAGSDGELTHKWWNGSTWSGWDWVGGVFKGAPAAVSWSQNRIDVFVRGMDDHLGHFWRG